MLRRFKHRGLMVALSVLWTALVMAQPVQGNASMASGAPSLLVQMWQSAWQRQPVRRDGVSPVCRLESSDSFLAGTDTKAVVQVEREGKTTSARFVLP
jgi:hypothetical protein